MICIPTYSSTQTRKYVETGRQTRVGIGPSLSSWEHKISQNPRHPYHNIRSCYLPPCHSFLLPTLSFSVHTNTWTSTTQNLMDRRSHCDIHAKGKLVSPLVVLMTFIPIPTDWFSPDTALALHDAIGFRVSVIMGR